MTGPQPPSSPLGEAGTAMHEMFLTLQASGFSHDDALKLIQGLLSDVIQATIKSQPDQAEQTE